MDILLIKSSENIYSGVDGSRIVRLKIRQNVTIFIDFVNYNKNKL